MSTTQIPVSVDTFSLRYFCLFKTFLRWFLILLLVFIGMVVAQGVFFCKVIMDFKTIVPADLVIAFEGNDKRVYAAYHLMDFSYAPILVISPASLDKIKEYDRKYQPRMNFERILEKKAKTTFENAFYTKEIIKEKRYNNVILVTSWDHLPRSYLLLKMMLIGTDVRIQVYGVPTGELDRTNWFKYADGWKMVYNEMAETYGSLVQMVDYFIDGKTSGMESKKSAFWGGIKKALLFEIDTDGMI